MNKSTKFRMGLGEKLFLGGAGILVLLFAGLAVPALMHLRDRGT